MPPKFNKYELATRPVSPRGGVVPVNVVSPSMIPMQSVVPITIPQVVRDPYLAVDPGIRRRFNDNRELVNIYLEFSKPDINPDEKTELSWEAADQMKKEIAYFANTYDNVLRSFYQPGVKGPRTFLNSMNDNIEQLEYLIEKFKSHQKYLADSEK